MDRRKGTEGSCCLSWDPLGQGCLTTRNKRPKNMIFKSGLPSRTFTVNLGDFKRTLSCTTCVNQPGWFHTLKYVKTNPDFNVSNQSFWINTTNKFRDAEKASFNFSVKTQIVGTFLHMKMQIYQHVLNLAYFLLCGIIYCRGDVQSCISYWNINLIICLRQFYLSRLERGFGFAHGKNSR